MAQNTPMPQAGADEMMNADPSGIMDLGSGSDPMAGMEQEMTLANELSVLGGIAGVDPDQINQIMELPEETIQQEVDAMFANLTAAAGGQENAGDQ